MCYSHVIRNCDKRLVSIQDKETRQQIRNDIGSLQLATSKEAFETASSLFLAKWSEANDIYLNIFLGNNFLECLRSYKSLLFDHLNDIIF